MSNEASSIVNRVWNYCHALRDDGFSYGGYAEQLTYLLFLKMADSEDDVLILTSALVIDMVRADSHK